MSLAVGVTRRVFIDEIAQRTSGQPGKQIPTAEKAIDLVTRKLKTWVGELLVQEDALYVTSETGKVEVEWLLDMGCGLRLILVDLYRKIPGAVRSKLQVNDVDMTTADGSQFSDRGKVHL